MPRAPRYPEHYSPRPQHDSRIDGIRLLAMGVLAKAVADATSRATDRAWRREAWQFLTAPERADDLGFWVEVLDVPLDHVRTLIGRALNGNKANKSGPNLDIIGESGRALTRTRHP
jgi:hypothetical protein